MPRSGWMPAWEQDFADLCRQWDAACYENAKGHAGHWPPVEKK